MIKWNKGRRNRGLKRPFNATAPPTSAFLTHALAQDDTHMAHADDEKEQIAQDLTDQPLPHLPLLPMGPRVSPTIRHGARTIWQRLRPFLPPPNQINESKMELVTLDPMFMCPVFDRPNMLGYKRQQHSHYANVHPMWVTTSTFKSRFLLPNAFHHLPFTLDCTPNMLPGISDAHVDDLNVVQWINAAVLTTQPVCEPALVFAHMPWQVLGDCLVPEAIERKSGNTATNTTPSVIPTPTPAPTRASPELPSMLPCMYVPSAAQVDALLHYVEQQTLALLRYRGTPHPYHPVRQAWLKQRHELYHKMDSHCSGVSTPLSESCARGACRLCIPLPTPRSQQLSQNTIANMQQQLSEQQRRREADLAALELPDVFVPVAGFFRTFKKTVVKHIWSINDPKYTPETTPHTTTSSSKRRREHKQSGRGRRLRRAAANKRRHYADDDDDDDDNDADDNEYGAQQYDDDDWDEQHPDTEDDDNMNSSDLVESDRSEDQRDPETSSGDEQPDYEGAFEEE